MDAFMDGTVSVVEHGQFIPIIGRLSRQSTKHDVVIQINSISPCMRLVTYVSASTTKHQLPYTRLIQFLRVPGWRSAWWFSRRLSRTGNKVYTGMHYILLHLSFFIVDTFVGVVSGRWIRSSHMSYHLIFWVVSLILPVSSHA